MKTKLTTYRFSAKGHRNIRATHKNTLEFTKDSEVSVRGDCIMGVEADFCVHTLRKVAQHCTEIKVCIEVGTNRQEFLAKVNPKFCDLNEVVIRVSDYISSRTFATRSQAAAKDIKRTIVNELKKPNTKLSVVIECLENS